jgi:L-threonylcarbamoyladenylate synthase
MSESMPVIAPSDSATMLDTVVLKTSDDQLTPADLRICIDTLNRGGLIVFPTETVYGVGCVAFNPHSIKQIYALKGRSYKKPLPILLAYREQIDLVARDIPANAPKLMDAFWPGALTLVFKTAPMAIAASGGRGTIAVRVPDHGIARQLLDELGLPLAATSANQSGAPSFKSGRDAIKFFKGKVDVIIDGGKCRVGRESTVVDATHEHFTVLREGAVPKRQLSECIGLI